MKIVWVCNPTEVETDLWRAAQNYPELTLETWVVSGLEGQLAPYFQHGVSELSVEGRLDFLARLAQSNADLYVFRHPTWLGEEPLRGAFRRLFAGLPVVAWASEQGPTRPEAIQAGVLFERVAVNARYELPLYRHWRPGTKLYYLPFGCARRQPDEMQPRREWATDLVADGGCHYQCGEHGGWKRTSVDVMVRPLLDQKLGLWGHGPEDHGWKGVPGVVEAGCYRGAYFAGEHVLLYRACSIYLGITWNWGLGGYGCKLARALASGVAVLWHRTVGMELDGLVPGLHLMTSATAEETRHAALWLLAAAETRHEIAAAGQQFALREWEWGANLIRLAHEVQAD
jgi:hypothetical protein